MASGNVLFKLLGQVFVDTDEADKSMSKTTSKAESMADKIGKGAKTIGKIATTTVATATAITGAMVENAKKTAEATDEIDKMSQKLGLTREGYQEWDYVLSQAGVDINSMQTGLKTLTNKLDDAKNGSKNATEMFSKLGISMEDINTMDRETLFENTIKGLQGMEDSTQRAALANDLFGKSGQELTALFNESAESTENLKKKAHELGLVMSDEAVQSGVEMHDTFDTLNRTFSTIGTNLGVAVMPIINDLCKVIIDNMPQIQKLVSDLAPIFADMIKEVVPPLIELLQEILPPLISLIKTLLPIVTSVTKGIASAVVGLINAIKPAINLVIKGLNKMFGALSMDIPNWVPLVGGKSIKLPSNIPLLANGGTVTSGGSVIVGEKGPEMLNLPTGASVVPLNKSDVMIDRLIECNEKMLGVMSQYLPQVANMRMVTDTGLLVGALAPQIDSQLGVIAKRKQRG